MGTFIDLTGRKFGKLTVLRQDGYKEVGKRNIRKPYWLCQCECGNVKRICGDNLRSGVSNSCGCEVRRATIERSTKHGFAKRGHERSRIYTIWANMIKRCENQSNDDYKNYGGRGITVCDEWHDFILFKEWAFKNGYADNLTIDRIDVNGNYEPDNCRWVCWDVQANNTRRTIKIKFGNVEYSLREWCEILNLNYHTVNSRRRKGIPTIEAMFTPVFHERKMQIEDMSK